MRKLKIAFISLFMIFSGLTGAFGYGESFIESGLGVKTDGLIAVRMNKNLLVLRQVSPDASLKLQNLGRSGPLQVKISNTGASSYQYFPDGGRIIKKGVNWVMADFHIPAGGSGNLKVLPPRGKLRRYTFAVLGDTAGGRAVHRKALKMISKSGAIFAVNMGDTVNCATEGNFTAFLKDLETFPIPCFVVRGNHERELPGGRGLFAATLNPCDYSFETGGFSFVILDNSSGYIGEDGFSWLTERLSLIKNSFVFMHIPPVSPFKQFDRHIMKSPYERTRFSELMEKYGVKAVFMGHVHGYWKESIRGVAYIISACAGSIPYMPPHMGGFYHYVLVHVDGDRFSTEVIPVNPLF